MNPVGTLRSGRPKAWVWATLAGLMALMLCLRIFPGWFYLVRPDGEFRLADPDAYYHFRQAVYTVENFPRLMRLDDSAFYPLVIWNDAAGLYDLVLASAAKVIALFGVEPVRALWWVALWFPPLCVTAIMPFLYHLVRHQGTIRIGLVMALWYVLLPGTTLANVTLGICDHHVVEMITSVVCIVLLQRHVERERAQRSAWWRPAWAAALPLALFQFTWIGAPLFLVVFGLATFGQLAADVMAGVGARPLVCAGIRYWLAFLILTAGLGLFLPAFLPNIWRASLAGSVVLLVVLALTGWYFETPRLRMPSRVRLALGTGVVATAAGFVYAASAEVRELARLGLSAKSTLVAENQEVTARFYFGVTGLAGVVGLLSPLAGIISGTWRRPGWWLMVLPSLFFIVLWYRTNDYAYQGALHAVLLAGYFFGALAIYLYPAGAKRRWPGDLTLAVATLAVVLCQTPAQWTAPWWLTGEWYQNFSGMPSDGWVEAMRWLRTATPVPPPPPANPTLGLSPRGRVGVLTDWCDGQFVNTLARRPATSSRYPVANGMIPFFLRTEEEVRRFDLRGEPLAASIRYVALGPRTIGDYFHAHRDTIGLAANTFYGRANFKSGSGNNIGVPTLGVAYDEAFATRLVVEDGRGLSHFRLIFESRQQSFLRFTHFPNTQAILPRSSLILTEADRAAASQSLWAGLWQEGNASAYLGHLLAAVKIFEQVEGAKVEGRAPPGSAVTFQVPLRLRTSGRAWQYTQSVRADEQGNFRMIVPYATAPATGTDVEPAGEAVLALEVAEGARPDRIAVNIPDSAVQNGDRVNWRGWLGQDPAATAKTGASGGLR